MLERVNPLRLLAVFRHFSQAVLRQRCWLPLKFLVDEKVKAKKLRRLAKHGRDPALDEDAICLAEDGEDMDEDSPPPLCSGDEATSSDASMCDEARCTLPESLLAAAASAGRQNKGPEQDTQQETTSEDRPSLLQQQVRTVLHSS